MRKVDVLIIGQGLAGSFLSFWLLQFGVDITVVDSPQLLPASAIGTGTFNPLAGRRFTPFWNFDHCLDALKEAMATIEPLLGTSLLFSYPIIRLFSHPEQHQLWERKRSQISRFIERPLSTDDLQPWIRSPIEGFITRHSYLLHTERFLTLWRQFLHSHNLLIEQRFSDDQLHFTQSAIYWDHQLQARFAVWCPGDGILRSSLWRSLLPFQYAKGESLTFKSEMLPEERIVNRGVHWAPLGNHLFRFGATYHWDLSSPLPSSSGYNQLVTQLSNLCAVPWTPIAVHSGIRITFPDHRPVIGPHPRYPRCWIFSGLGTKGVGYAPFLAYLLYQAMLKGQSIPLDIAINRWT